MKITFFKPVWLILIALILNGAIVSFSFADTTVGSTEEWKLSQGGKIYDSWSKILKITSPTKSHPAYPKSGKKTGASTWRCKECHGWDYRGRNGAYGSGSSHFTGIKGIRDMEGKPVKFIKSIVRDKLHGYSSTMIPDIALDNLALFISKGQLDMMKYIDSNTKKVTGNSKRGAIFFETICANCHGLDGRLINFHAGRKPAEYVGTIAAKNPWELLHKIRNGQPGSAMVSLRTLTIQDQIDIVAYTKTLPTK